MKILVAGAQGQVGRELSRQCRTAGHQVIALDRHGMDIRDANSVRRAFTATSPQLVFNAAAWTAVDEAESRFDDAIRVNRDGAGNLALACAEHSIPMVHYSTDHVFDGRQRTAYTEDDATNPVNAYGRSKLAGEEAVRAVLDRHLIFRTSWVFSAHGSNFVKTMLKLGSERTNLRVVCDQVGKPTSAAAIAGISLAVVTRDHVSWGTYHLAQPEAVSRHEFAVTILEAAARQGCALAVEEVISVSTREFPTVAERPANSALDCSKLEDSFQIEIPDWHGPLDLAIGELIRDEFPA